MPVSATSRSCSSRQASPAAASSSTVSETGPYGVPTVTTSEMLVGGRGDEPGGLASTGMTDEELAGAEAGEGVHHPGEAGALAEGAVRVPGGQPAGLAGAQHDEPLAGHRAPAR